MDLLQAIKQLQDTMSIAMGQCRQIAEFPLVGTEFPEEEVSRQLARCRLYWGELGTQLINAEIVIGVEGSIRFKYRVRYYTGPEGGSEGGSLNGPWSDLEAARRFARGRKKRHHVYGYNPTTNNFEQLPDEEEA